MYRHIALLFGAALLGLVQAEHPQIPQVTSPPGPQRTAAPRARAKRQHEKRTIEIHRAYAAPIGVDTQYLTTEGSTTKWIGVNTEYLTDEIRTTTAADNVESTTVVKPQLAVATATEDSEGVDAGDVTVLMSDAVQDELDALIKDAAAACAGAKLRKRDAMSCMINSMQTAAQNDETLGLINPAEWDGFVLELAENAPDILGAAVQVLKTQAQKNKFAIMVAAAATAGALTATEEVAEVAEAVHKFIFSDGLFGYLEEEENPDGEDDDDDPEQPTATSSAQSCDPSAEVDENSPACDDEDCKGDEEDVCQAEGKKKNCPCLHWVKRMVEGYFDRDWSDAQQNILKELEEEVPDTTPPQCFRNTHGDGFNGEPAAEPSAFCHCTGLGSEGKATEGNFATMSGEGDDACTYTTMPTETISISLKPKQTEVTSCRIESSLSLDPYCTCNDNSIHGHIVTTYKGTETTVCPDATATMTEAPATTVPEPSCYPTHGPPHNDPDRDQIINICAARRQDFGSVCRSSDTRNSRGARVLCPGWHGGTERPVGNNDYKAHFQPASGKPGDCNYLFGMREVDDKGERDHQIDALCIPAFEAIRDKCSWNGGEVKTECGTFKYQSCPKGEDCKWGSPQG